MRGYGAIANRLQRKPRNPMAKQVHHTEEEAKASMGIPRTGKLPPDVDTATKRVESLRPMRHGKYTGKVFDAASGTQHKLMNRSLKNQKKEMTERLREKSKMLAEKMKDPGFEKEREDKKKELQQLKRQMDALLKQYDSYGSKDEE